MIKLFDFIENQAQRFTYTVMKLVGVSDESLEKYLKAVKAQDEKTIDADEELKTKAPIIKILFYLALMIFGAFIVDRIFNRGRR